MRIAIAFFTITSCILAQSGVLERTLKFQYGGMAGTMFEIDVDGKEYWVTAAHLLTGAKTGPPYGKFAAKTADLQVLDPGEPTETFKTVTFSVFQATSADIAVLVSKSSLIGRAPTGPKVVPDARLTIGGPCQFIGYPYSRTWQTIRADGKKFWMPFIKHCTVSGLGPSRECGGSMDSIIKASLADL